MLPKSGKWGYTPHAGPSNTPLEPIPTRTSNPDGASHFNAPNDPLVSQSLCPNDDTLRRLSGVPISASSASEPWSSYNLSSRLAGRDKSSFSPRRLVRGLPAPETIDVLHGHRPPSSFGESPRQQRTLRPRSRSSAEQKDQVPAYYPKKSQSLKRPTARGSPQELQCDVCQKVIKGRHCRRNLNKHKKSVHSNKRFLCTECTKPFNRKDNLHRHSREKHPRQNVMSDASVQPYQNLPTPAATSTVVIDPSCHSNWPIQTNHLNQGHLIPFQTSAQSSHSGDQWLANGSSHGIISTQTGPSTVSNPRESAFVQLYDVTYREVSGARTAPEYPNSYGHCEPHSAASLQSEPVSMSPVQALSFSDLSFYSQEFDTLIPRLEDPPDRMHPDTLQWEDDFQAFVESDSQPSTS